MKIRRNLSLIFLALSLLTAAMIFGFSADTGPESSKLSNDVTLQVAEVVNPDYRELPMPTRLSFLSRGTTYLPAEAPNLDELAFLPVAAGYWRQHEMWDGTYTLDDLLDIAELIQVTRENEIRSRESEV